MVEDIWLGNVRVKGLVKKGILGHMILLIHIFFYPILKIFCYFNIFSGVGDKSERFPFHTVINRGLYRFYDKNFMLSESFEQVRDNQRTNEPPCYAPSGCTRIIG